MKKCVFLFMLLFLPVGMSLPWPGFVPQLFAGEGSVKILILGDSLGAGLGVEPQQAFPALIRDRLKLKGFDHVSLINGSISGSTTAGAVSRLKWFLRIKPDILVLALGANDGLRGLSIRQMTRNLDKTIVLAKEKRLRVILAGMKLPPNYGPEYAKAFEAVFASLAQKHDLPFIPFLLKDVAGIASLNQADGIHPNAKGHKIIAATVFDCILKQL
ncbi:arylesterase [Desulfobacula phenolica]|uniref:Acyl-CoA thioesterase-1 n=1 Tax=Desulfobacula phenolica TaxID=90732 RepID=A0A1H2JQ09_9BACT|nr:arylesterase [Desulfobacula phenolica]SDU58634.1 acyl-CoA thioesterase-1 [Desulfobacula phenolica]